MCRKRFLGNTVESGSDRGSQQTYSQSAAGDVCTHDGGGEREGKMEI